MQPNVRSLRWSRPGSMAPGYARPGSCPTAGAAPWNGSGPGNSPRRSDTSQRSRRGTLGVPAGRDPGIHFADVHRPGRNVVSVSSAILDVIVDVRIGSPSYGRWEAIQLDDADRRAIFLSEGLGHAFIALSAKATVLFLCTTAYAPGREHSVNPDDPGIGIAWPADTEPVLSGRDAAAPRCSRLSATGCCRPTLTAWPTGTGCTVPPTARARPSDVQLPAGDRPSACRRGFAAPRRRPPGAPASGPAANSRSAADLPGPGTVAEHAVAGTGRWPGRRCRIGLTRAGSAPSSRKISRASPNQVVCPELVAW